MSGPRTAGTLLLLIAGTLVLAGCQHGGRPGRESQLERWVREAVEGDPRVRGAEFVSVESDDGIVTLEGRVPTLAARRYAVLQAQQIHGVVGVIDRLDVQPDADPPGDDEIRDAIERSLRASLVDPEARYFISVEGGYVALEGDVATWAEVQEAGLIASQISGVREVTNHLAARRRTDLPDRSLAARIDHSFRTDAMLAHLPLQAIVANGDVRVVGEVDSAYERERALRRARNLAPDGVVEDEVQVTAEPSRLPDGPGAPEGAALARLVEAELALDARLRGASIEVDADGRLIALEGSVRNLAQRRFAEEDARNVAGVAWVSNDLAAPHAGRDDEALRGEIATALAPLIGLATLEIEVENGVVTLAGTAPDWAARGHAGVLAASVDGVSLVRNRVGVALEAGISDEDVAQRIATDLRRNAATARVAERIEVTVASGFVRLVGDVDTWGQWQSASRIARRAPGTRGVENQLAVDPYPSSFVAPAQLDSVQEYDPPYPPNP